jgi:UPF0176 protein
MSEQDYQIIIYYKYVSLTDPARLVEEQKEICTRLNLKGRILIAEEGINGTVEGKTADIAEYCQDLLSRPEFADMKIKVTPGTGNAFPKLAVKLRKEIVASHLGDDDVNPNELSGKYLSVDELHQWFEEGREFYIVDMRNDYEQKVGHFENSIFTGMTNFRDLGKIIPKLEHLKDKTVVTVCTYGVRCEKASGFLVKKGFRDVYQLLDGIGTYMEKYPNHKYLGKLYVFDGRITLGFNMTEPAYQMVGRCDHCGSPSENYINCAYPECHKHFICCENCLVDGESFCSVECKQIKEKVS